MGGPPWGLGGGFGPPSYIVKKCPALPCDLIDNYKEIFGAIYNIYIREIFGCCRYVSKYHRPQISPEKGFAEEVAEAVYFCH